MESYPEIEISHVNKKMSVLVWAEHRHKAQVKTKKFIIATPPLPHRAAINNIREKKKLNNENNNDNGN